MSFLSCFSKVQQLLLRHHGWTCWGSKWRIKCEPDIVQSRIRAQWMANFMQNPNMSFWSTYLEWIKRYAKFTVGEVTLQFRKEGKTVVLTLWIFFFVATKPFKRLPNSWKWQEKGWSCCFTFGRSDSLENGVFSWRQQTVRFLVKTKETSSVFCWKWFSVESKFYSVFCWKQVKQKILQKIEYTVVLDASLC